MRHCSIGKVACRDGAAANLASKWFDTRLEAVTFWYILTFLTFGWPKPEAPPWNIMKHEHASGMGAQQELGIGSCQWLGWSERQHMATKLCKNRFLRWCHLWSGQAVAFPRSGQWQHKAAIRSSLSRVLYLPKDAFLWEGESLSTSHPLGSISRSVSHFRMIATFIWWLVLVAASGRWGQKPPWWVPFWLLVGASNHMSPCEKYPEFGCFTVRNDRLHISHRRSSVGLALWVNSNGSYRCCGGWWKDVPWA